MAIIRNNTQQFTVVSQSIMRDDRLSLKDTGLLVRLLSLPDNWEFSENGLIAIFQNDGQTAIRTALKHLESCGYLKRIRTRDEKGKISGVEWIIYDKPHFENHSLDFPDLVNQPQSNTNVSSTNESSTKEKGDSKGREKKQTNYDSIIKDYTTNQDLRNVLFEFVKMRQRIRKPLTNYALTLLTKRLDKMTDSADAKIDMLNQSIVNGWQDVYELKNQTRKEVKTDAEHVRRDQRNNETYERGIGWNKIL